MGGELRAAFDLSHTAYGALYSLATITSAALLFRLGGLADTWRLPHVTAFALLILMCGCLAIGLAPGVVILGVGFVLIRLGGQGLIAHLGMTTAARYFPAHRGKAVALAAAGFPLAESILPPLAVVLIGLFGWRAPWLAGGGLLVLLVLPALVFLSRHAPLPSTLPSESAPSPGEVAAVIFSRGDVLRDRGFYFLLPAALVTPFTATALFFHQVALAELRGWSLELVATAFGAYAAGHLISLLASGPAVDRFGARRVLPPALLPMMAGMLVVAFVRHEVAAYIYLTLIGVTHGFAATSAGALLADRYGVVHLGAIRAMVQSVMVVATAVAPVMLGFLLDREIPLTRLASGLAVLIALAALAAWLAPQPRRRGP